MKVIWLAVITLVSQFTVAHGGSLDNQGGHNDRKNGGYHCHRSPCGTTVTPVEKANPQSKYNRKSWAHWSDFDSDCMNTRHEILLIQADGPVKKSPDGCYISSGTWDDPFSGKTLHRASDLDVDHIVPLKWASIHGGALWPKYKKEQFANDPINLLAVDDSLNQSKGAKGPSQWMPPNHAFRCEYVELWQSVLAKYTHLKMTEKENRVFKNQIKSCQ